MKNTGKTLWLFGDSYLSKKEDFLLGRQNITAYWEIIAKETGCDVIKNTALGGTSIEWVFYQYNDAMKNIKKNDVIIIAITNLKRRWLFKDYPYLTNSELVKFTGYKSEGMEEALTDIFLDPFHEITAQKLDLFLKLLAYHQKEIGFEVILLDAFPNNVTSYHTGNFLTSKGQLYTVSHKEHCTSKSKETQKFFLENRDVRVNHFSQENHTILADKILKSIETRDTIDLETGFKENFVDLYKIKKELYDE